jgi:hypothetical protein
MEKNFFLSKYSYANAHDILNEGVLDDIQTKYHHRLQGVAL